MGSITSFSSNKIFGSAIVLIAALVVIPHSAQAFKISAAAGRLDTSTDGSTLGTGENSTHLLNLKAGAMVASQIFVGGIYDSRTDESSGSKTERTGYGATLGYHSNGWFLDGSFLFSSSIKTPGGAMIEGGTGFGIDLGGTFDVMSNVFVGLQMSYKSISYTKVDGVEQSNKIKSELTPMLLVGVDF
ncbi:MAG: hypothetical protein J0L82_17960 [Deltaproteobacteria bacterium]|jgi:hypothetical protein|nr:hypothetical protein [Deltaproteobacteria bacterium]